MFHCLAVPDLTDQNDVRGLTECVGECAFESQRVAANFPLVNDSTFVRMSEFNRIFNRDDVTLRVLITLVEQG